jgi:hypothetical protein
VQKPVILQKVNRAAVYERQHVNVDFGLGIFRRLVVDALFELLARPLASIPVAVDRRAAIAQKEFAYSAVTASGLNGGLRSRTKSKISVSPSLWAIASVKLVRASNRRIDKGLDSSAAAPEAVPSLQV